MDMLLKTVNASIKNFLILIFCPGLVSSDTCLSFLYNSGLLPKLLPESSDRDSHSISFSRKAVSYNFQWWMYIKITNKQYDYFKTKYTNVSSTFYFGKYLPTRVFFKRIAYHKSPLMVSLHWRCFFKLFNCPFIITQINLENEKRCVLYIVTLVLSSRDCTRSEIHNLLLSRYNKS